jgi:transcriptional regulator with XRE-family HTH domain
MEQTGDRIRIRRQELGMSVDDVAAKLNINRATIYRYESNEIRNFSISILKPLAKVLKTTPAFLMGWEDIPDEAEISPDDFRLLSAYHSASDKEKAVIETLLGLGEPKDE